MIVSLEEEIVHPHDSKSHVQKGINRSVVVYKISRVEH